MKRGIDVGNYSLKEFPNTNIKSLINTEESLLSSTSIKLEYDNKVYYIGEGNYETELIKSNKENFLPLLLTGLALNSPDYDIFQQVVCGLPISQYSQNKEALINLVVNERVREIKLNDVPKKLIINNFSVYPESVGAYYSLNTHDDLILVDIGGRTSDIAYIVDGKLKQSSTVIVGTINIYKDVADKLKNLYGLNIGIQEAERIIGRGYLQIDGEDIDLNFIKEILKTNFIMVNDELNLKFPARMEKIILVGGGFKLFEKAFKNRYRNCYVAEQPIYANSIGFRKVAEKLWI